MNVGKLQVVKELRSEWSNTITHDGGHCVVCSRWGKVYGRNINRTMAKSLAWLKAACDEVGGDRWVEVARKAPRWMVRSNQLSTLKSWGLVERLTSDEGKVKHSGIWRVTGLGVAFVEGRIAVPYKVYTYNDMVHDVSDDTVTFAECFEDTFDYQATMNEIYANASMRSVEEVE